MTDDTEALRREQQAAAMAAVAAAEAEAENPETTTETTPLLRNRDPGPDPPLQEDRQQLYFEHHAFPEGGPQAWSVVAGCWCAMVVAFGLLTSVGVMEAWLHAHQLRGYSHAQIGWIFSTFTFLLYFGSLQVGPIFDAHGLKYTLYPGCVGLVIAIFLLSVCEEYWQFMLDWGILGGISCCMVFTPAVVSVGHWFMVRRAVATGIAMTAGGFGGVLFPLIVLLVSPRLGFAGAIRVISLLSVLLCGLALALVKTRLPYNKRAGGGIDLLALREPIYALTTLGTFLVEWALFVPNTYLTAYAISKGMDEKLAYELIAFLNAGSILGRLVPGYWADRWGRFNVMILTSVGTAVVTLTLWLAAGDNMPAIVAYAVLFGFWSGCMISLTPVCVAQVCKTEDYGKRYGCTYFLVSFGTLTGIPLAGAILETGSGGAENWAGLIVFTGTVFLAGALAFAAARGLAVGWRWRVVF